MGESLGHSTRRYRSTRSDLRESPGTGEASGTPNGVEMLSGEHPLLGAPIRGSWSRSTA